MWSQKKTPHFHVIQIGRAISGLGPIVKNTLSCLVPTISMTRRQDTNRWNEDPMAFGVPTPWVRLIPSDRCDTSAEKI